LIWNQRHLMTVQREYEDFYNIHRPHRTLNQAAPLRPLPDGVTGLDHFRVGHPQAWLETPRQPRGYMLGAVVPVAAGSAGRAQSSPGMCEHVDGRLSRPTSRTPGSGRDHRVRVIAFTSRSAQPSLPEAGSPRCELARSCGSTSAKRHSRGAQRAGQPPCGEPLGNLAAKLAVAGAGIAGAVIGNTSGKMRGRELWAGARFAMTQVINCRGFPPEFPGTQRRYLAFSEAVDAFPSRKRAFPGQFPRNSSLTAAELITVRPRAFPAAPAAFPAPALAGRQPPRAPALTWPHDLAGPGRHEPAGTDQGG